MEVAYPSYTVEFSPFMGDGIHVCNSELHDYYYSDDNSVWNAVSESDFTQTAEHDGEILGVDMSDALDAGYMQDLCSGYSAEDTEGSTEGSSTFCWRPYWRT